jgi:2-polyprenyl-3-methyl-5-hydroxy-6-metoxy-1,4-benzoquinol methylase
MVNCLLCGGHGGEVIYEFPKYNNKIIKCDCEFIYSKIEDRPNVDFAYENDYWTTYQILQGEKSIYDRIEEFEFISDERMGFITEFKRGGKLLDVGCSMGFLVNSANKLGFESLGIDPNKECIEYGQKKYEPINLSTTLLENLQDNDFDVITCFNVIEHLDDPKKFLDECYKRLKQNGILVIGTHDIESETHNTLKSEWKQITEDGDHLFYFSQSTMKKFAEMNGYKVIKTHKPIDPSFTIYLEKNEI